jgi:plastocyanin
MMITKQDRGQDRSLTRQGLRSRGAGIVVLVLFALVLAACGSSSKAAATSTTQHPSTTTTASSTSSNKPATSLTIIIKDYAFHPDKAVVAPGAHIVVKNEDSVTHTFTSTTGAFNTGDIHPGHEATLVAPTKPGKYPYYCEIHPFMTGVLIVR